MIISATNVLTHLASYLNHDKYHPCDFSNSFLSKNMFILGSGQTVTFAPPIDIFYP